MKHFENKHVFYLDLGSIEHELGWDLAKVRALRGQNWEQFETPKLKL